MQTISGKSPSRAGKLAGAVAMLLAVAAQGADLNFDIPAGDLKAALDSYIKQTGQQIVYKSDDVKGKTTPGVHGSLSEQQALDALIKGTGLQLRRDASGAVVVFPAEAVAGAASTMKAGSDEELEEIIVTGTPISHLYVTSRTVSRLDTDPMHLPQSVTTVQGDLLRSQQVSSLSDVLDNVAGMDVTATNTVTSRGFSVSAARNGTVAGGDRSSRIGARPIVATERVEVVKGPEQIMQGTLGGIGGTVNLVTKVPQPEDYAFIGTAMGNQGYWRLDADVNGTLLGNEDGRLMGQVIGSISDQGDGKYGIKGNSLDFVSAGLRWLDPDLGSELSVVSEYEQSSRGALLSAATTGDSFHNGDKEWLFGDKNSYSDRDSTLIDVNFTQRLWESWHLAVNYVWQDVSASGNNFIFYGSGPDTVTGSQTKVRDLQDGTDTIKTDLRGSFSTGPLLHNVVVAYDYDVKHSTSRNATTVGDYSTNIATGVQEFAACDLFCDQGTSKSTDRETGILATDQINWGKWYAILGVRWLSISNDVSFKSGDFAFSDKDSNDDTLPQFGLVYAATPRLSFYFSGTDGMYPIGSFYVDMNGNSLPNQTYTQYEGGMKALLLDQQLALTIAAYRIHEEDVPQQLPFDPDCPGLFGACFESIAGITSKGIEVELSGQPIDGLQVRASFSYLDSSDDTTDEPPTGGYVPAKFSLWSQYWFGREAGLGWWAGGGLTANDAYSLPSGSAQLPGNTVIDLSGGYQDEHWVAIAGIKNVGDVRGYYPAAGFPDAMVYLASQSPGCEYRFDLSYRF